MAIALDTTTLKVLTASPVTSSHTCTGSNLLLIAGIWGSTDYVTTVTYNSVGMTRLQDFIHPTVGDYHMSLFYLIAPSTGANNIVATGTGSFVIIGASYTGCAQSGQPDALTTNSNVAASSITTNITTIANNCWIITMFDGTASGPSSGTNYTQRQVTGDNALGDTNAAVSAGANSTTVNIAAGANATIVASIAPPSITKNLPLLGVGT